MSTSIECHDSSWYANMAWKMGVRLRSRPVPSAATTWCHGTSYDHVDRSQSAKQAGEDFIPSS
eukprot:scaffold1466_cov385-Prasinococcus_capsulatus_cf.AAC.10